MESSAPLHSDPGCSNYSLGIFLRAYITAREYYQVCNSLTETLQAKLFYLECSFALRYIAIQFGYEKQGYERITSNNLSPGIRTWLARRGINKWDMLKLKFLAGNVSITAGLLLLVHSIKGRILGTIHEPAKETDDTAYMHDEVELAIEELL